MRWFLLVLGCAGCVAPTGSDGGAPPLDAGADLDAGRDSGVDASIDGGTDAGADDAGVIDAGFDAGLPAWPDDAYFLEGSRTPGFFGSPCRLPDGGFSFLLTWEVSLPSGATHASGCRSSPPAGRLIESTFTLTTAELQLLSRRLAEMTVASEPRCFSDVPTERLIASTPMGRVAFVDERSCVGLDPATIVATGLSSALQVLDDATCADGGC